MIITVVVTAATLEWRTMELPYSVELHKTSVLSEPCLSLGINLQKMDGQVFIQLGKYYSV